MASRLNFNNADNESPVKRRAVQNGTPMEAETSEATAFEAEQEQEDRQDNLQFMQLTPPIAMYKDVVTLPKYDIGEITSNLAGLNVNGKSWSDATNGKTFKQLFLIEMIETKKDASGKVQVLNPSDFKTERNAFAHLVAPYIRFGKAEGIIPNGDKEDSFFVVCAFLYTIFEMKEENIQVLADWVRPLNPETNKFAASGWANIFETEYTAWKQARAAKPKPTKKPTVEERLATKATADAAGQVTVPVKTEKK